MSPLNRRTLFAGTIGIAIAATVGKEPANAAAPIPRIPSGEELSVNIMEASRQLWASHRDGKEQVVLLNATTKTILDRKFDDLAVESVGPGAVRHRFANITFTVDHHLPNGTMLLIPKSEYVSWRAMMDDAILMTNIGD